MIFTTSWDDGTHFDKEIADLLERYDCTGTFYCCPTKEGSVELLTEQEIRILSRKHEIGAHTMTHPWLTRLEENKMKEELTESKTWIEAVTGKPCAMFCYPYGDQNDGVRAAVELAGYRGARTAEEMEFNAEDIFLLPTSWKVTPFPTRKRWSKVWHPLDPLGPLRARFKKLRTINTPLASMGSWLSAALFLFEYALATEQPWFHLWGHGTELDRFKMWNDLEAFLKHVSQTPKVECVVNSELIT